MAALTEKVGRTYDRLRQRKMAYQLAFGSPAGKKILEDLAKFCRANQSCFDTDPRVEAAMLGRQEVWLRIMHHLHMPSEEIFKLYYQVGLTQGENENG